MDYRKLVQMIPAEKWGMVSDKFADLILTSKNDDKMPGQLANIILHYAQHGVIKTESGLAALLEAALLLESDKTLSTLDELQMRDITKEIREASKP